MALLFGEFLILRRVTALLIALNFANQPAAEVAQCKGSIISTGKHCPVEEVLNGDLFVENQVGSGAPQFGRGETNGNFEF